MNTRFIYVFSALLLFFVSCEENEDKGTAWDNPNFIRLTADTEAVAVPDQENMNISWVDGDSVAVFDNKGRSVALATNYASSSVFHSYRWHEGAFPEYAAFPWSEDATCTGAGLVGITVPSVQKVSRTSRFDNFVAVGQVTGNKTSYKASPMYNVTGFVTVSLSRPDAVSVKLESVGGEAMAGQIEVDYEKLEGGEAGYFAVAGDMLPAVTLLPTSEEELLKTGKYYVALLPGTYSKGFRTTVTYSSGKQITNVLMPGGVTVGRSELVAFGEEPIDETQPDEIELSLDFSAGWPFKEPVIAQDGQSDAGDTYTYEYTSAEAQETLQWQFLLLGQPTYDFKDGYLNPGLSRFGRISIPGISGRYLKSVRVEVMNDAAKNFEFKNSSRQTIDVGPMAASENAPLVLSFPTPNGVNTEKGATYHLSFITADTHVSRIVLNYTRTQPEI